MELLSLGYLPLKFAITTSNTVDGKTPVIMGDVITGQHSFYKSTAALSTNNKRNVLLIYTEQVE